MTVSSSSPQMSTLGPAVGEKLTRENWILWKAQFLPVIHVAPLMDYLHEKSVVLPVEITVMIDDKKEAKLPNPEYIT
jgi:hypothetical protein